MAFRRRERCVSQNACEMMGNEQAVVIASLLGRQGEAASPQMRCTGWIRAVFCGAVNGEGATGVVLI